MADHIVNPRKRKRESELFKHPGQVGSKQLKIKNGKRDVRKLRERLEKVYVNYQSMTERFQRKPTTKSSTATYADTFAHLVTAKLTKRFWAVLRRLKNLDGKLSTRSFDAIISELVAAEEAELNDLTSEVDALEKDWSGAMTLTELIASKILIVSFQLDHLTVTDCFRRCRMIQMRRRKESNDELGGNIKLRWITEWFGLHIVC